MSAMSASSASLNASLVASSASLTASAASIATSAASMATSAASMANPKILNYYSPLSPIQLKNSLTLLVGAGDTVHTLTNVEEFRNFDMLLCNPSIHQQESFLANVEKLGEDSPYICYMDLYSEKHVKAFIHDFRGRFSLIEGHGFHVPHFTLSQLEKLLQEGGTASNIFEQSCNVINISTYLRWLEEGFVNSESNVLMSTAIVVSSGHLNLTENDANLLRESLCKAIISLNATNRNIHLDEELLMNLGSLSTRSCQKIHASLLCDSSTPLTLLGNICTNTPSWSCDPTIELVITKKAPPFWEDAIQAYIDAYGRDEHVERAERIRAAIAKDLEDELIWPAKAKYDTYTRLIRANILK